MIKFLLSKIHELNGCIVGPGLYQEWTSFVYAAKNCKEQNLELCRSQSNNMLFYRAIKPIQKGDHLLAWYSSSVEVELFKHALMLQADEDIKILNGYLDSIDGIKCIISLNKNFN